MPRTTVAQLERRVENVDGCIDAVMDKIDVMMERQMEDRAILNKHTKILENGLTERVSKAVSAEVNDVQLAWLKELLEQQKQENREYGKRKDEERKQAEEINQKEIDRKMKFWSIIVPAIISAAAIITVALIGLV